MEEAVAVEKELLAVTLYSIGDGVIPTDAEGKIVLFNPIAEKLTGWTQEEAIGRPLEEVFHIINEKTRQHCKSPIEKVIKAGEIIGLDRHTVLVARDGTERVVSASSAPIRDKYSNTIGAVLVFRDITRLKRAEENLRESEALFRAVFEGAAIGMALVDMEGRPVVSNPALEDMLGYSGGELRNMVFTEFTHPEDATTDWELFKELIEGKRDCYQIEKRYYRKDGRLVWGRLTVSIIRRAEDEPHLIIGMVEDITDRKLTEEALRENLSQLSKKNCYETIIGNITRSVHQSINLQDVLENAVETIKKNMEEVNNAAIYLIEGEEAVLKAHRGYPPWFIKRIKRIPYPKGLTWKIILQEKPVYCADIDQDTVIDSAGRELGIKSYVSMPIYLKGKTVGAISITSSKKNAFDEEELKLLEMIAKQIEVAINNAWIAEALRESEERYRTLFDQSPVGIYIFDKDFKITQCNERLVQILQSSYDDIIGLNMRELKDQSFVPAIEEVFKGEFSHHESFYEAITKSVKLWLSIRLSPLRDTNGNIIGGIGVVEDITERKRRELLKANKNRVFELLAMGIPLSEILTALTHIIEGQIYEAWCSILLIDEEGKHLRLGAAPSLPDDFIQAIDGLEIGPYTGSCGTAAYRREIVIVENIATDPLWRGFRELALKYGLRACWSTPILSNDGQVLGTICIYYQQVRSPSSEEMELVKTVAQLGGIAIERRRT